MYASIERFLRPLSIPVNVRVGIVCAYIRTPIVALNTIDRILYGLCMLRIRHDHLSLALGQTIHAGARAKFYD